MITDEMIERYLYGLDGICKTNLIRMLLKGDPSDKQFVEDQIREHEYMFSWGSK